MRIDFTKEELELIRLHREKIAENERIQSKKYEGTLKHDLYYVDDNDDYHHIRFEGLDTGDYYDPDDKYDEDMPLLLTVKQRKEMLKEIMRRVKDIEFERIPKGTKFFSDTGVYDGVTVMYWRTRNKKWENFTDLWAKKNLVNIREIKKNTQKKKS